MVKNTKKIIALILSAIAILSLLSGCGKSTSDFEIKKHDDQTYIVLDDDYEGAYKETYAGEFHKNTITSDDDTEIEDPSMFALNQSKLMEYEQYSAFFTNHKLEQKYTDENMKYIVLISATDYVCDIDLNLNNIEFTDDIAHITVRDKILGDEPDEIFKKNEFTISYVVIPVKNTINEIDIKLIVYEKEFKEISKIHTVVHEQQVVKKPVLYFYPTQKTDIQVKFPYAENLTCTYPKYTNGWNIMAQPDGTLKDINTSRDLYSLYYECNPITEFKMPNKGFIVKGEDSAEFLEKKLDLLGLNYKEAEEFIIYWLPILESNKYNHIYFVVNEEVNKQMPIEILPKPDTTIRVWMYFKGLENPIDIQEQNLESQPRTGFAVVEWGGSEIK